MNTNAPISLQVLGGFMDIKDILCLKVLSLDSHLISRGKVNGNAWEDISDNYFQIIISCDYYNAGMDYQDNIAPSKS